MLTRTRCDGIEYAWVSKRGKCEGDALPDGVAGARVGVDHRFERFGPPGGSLAAVGEDCDGLGCGGGIECPAEQFGRWPVIEGGGVEEGFEIGRAHVLTPVTWPTRML